MKYLNYYGLPLPALNEGEMAVGACVTLKVVDDQGHISYREFKSQEIHSIEALGMLETFIDSVKEHIHSGTRRTE